MSNCLDLYGCPEDQCPDFVIKRHDTKPDFQVNIGDCDGAFDLTDTSLVLEANMWANAKLKRAITADDTYFGFADNIGFNQVMVGDILVFDRVRLPEYMLVNAFDESNNLVQVIRGYNGSTPSNWKKGAPIKIFRILNGQASINSVLGDLIQEDGTTLSDQLLQTLLVYEWSANDTCLPGCYWLEFKLLKMAEEVGMLSISTTPSFTPSTFSSSDFGCSLATGIEWIRRFPLGSEGFLIKIENTSTGD